MIITCEVGPFPTNAYFYIDDETQHGFLIDPGYEAEKLLYLIDKRQWTIEKILLTHGHFDHISAVNDLQSKLKIPVYIHKNGRDYVKDAKMNGSIIFFGLPVVIDGEVNYIDDNSEIVLSTNKDFKLKLIAVPGHTTDGAIYYSQRDNAAFVGDSIFHKSIGRTDLPGGNYETLINSIKQKIFTLPNETILLSGHSEPTTVEDEKFRPWFNYSVN
ncbi:MAG: MBL fold metallo-hydrolase [Selenomonadaceae bacterium]|nr:MBL fold metallo-hydrolase [Selenomonadaceae bacterium]